MRALGLACLMSITALPVHAQGPQAMERDSWVGPINPGSTIRVDNPHGDVRLRHGGADPALEVAAVLQQIAIDGSKLVLDVSVTDNEAVISIVRLDHEGQPAHDVPRGDRARADLALMIPEGFPVHAATTAGLLEVRGVRSDVDLSTVAGTIRVAETRGRINARSDRGTVEITLVTGATFGAQRLSTVTGPITVFTAPTNDLDVSMATSGSLTTDFSLDVVHVDHREPDKTATATIGRGGHPLAMTSQRGDLALRRVVTVSTD